MVSLEKHVQQLRNVIAKHTGSSMPQVRQKLQSEKFDFDRFKRRHVLLRVSYFGWDYMGFATQEDAGKSIESELFAALLQTKLVRSREESNYHRCGRTDRGVSATGQVRVQFSDVGLNFPCQGDIPGPAHSLDGWGRRICPRGF